MLVFPGSTFFGQRRPSCLQLGKTHIQLRGAIGQLLPSLGIQGFAGCLLLLESQRLPLKFDLQRRQLFGLSGVADFRFEAFGLPCPTLVVQQGTGVLQLRLKDFQFRFTGFPPFSRFGLLRLPLGPKPVQFRLPELKIRLLGVDFSMLFVQGTKADLDLGQLPVDRPLLVAQVFAGQARLPGFNHFQIDGPDVQIIARLQQRLAEVSAVQPGVGRPTPDHRAAGATENQTMNRPYIVSP